MPQTTTMRTAGDEMLQAAILMEELGKDFYEALAAVAADPEMRALCRELAVQEASHLQTFRRLRSDQARRGLTVLLQDDRLTHARQAVKASILPDRETIRRVAREGSADDVLAMAIRMEADAVRFYTKLSSGLKAAGAVEAIIREEQEHLRILTGIRTRRQRPQ